MTALAQTAPGSANGRPATARPYHHFTVDVEEYFQVSALEPYVERAQWESLPSRVCASTEALLDLLDSKQMRGTFFVLGWIAERYPALVRDIAQRGHEVASHGTDHRRVTFLTPSEFRGSVRDSKQILEQVTGQKVSGYRAPSFSIVAGREWALDILAEEGYAYDSSLYPVRRSGYGYRAALPHPYVIRTESGPLMEFPPATLQMFGAKLPAGGGAYLRLLPGLLVRSALQQAQARGYPATLYIHPWEVDPDQPRVAVPMLTRIRHYGYLERTYPRLRQLCERFSFRAIADSLTSLSQA
ncbi:MAG TPA: XrtA system polysaccharide deacetylase [Longimicrobiales bacterium]|nr:XrtA system polysaccharide deacetylase [Longimicrobiales bacterium]